MSEAERQFAEDKQLRDSAHALVRERIAMVRSDLAARSVRDRATDALVGKAQELAHHALDVAEEYPGIIAGSVGAAALWIMRKPLITLGLGAWMAHRGSQRAEPE